MPDTVVLPRTLAEALRALHDDPEASVLAGGTDLMVDVNAGRHRPSSVVSLTHVPELRGWHRDGAEIVLGACLTYADMERGEVASLVPALAQAARTVGSPQIRAAATIGGNLGTASPAGDMLPVLAALDAMIEVAGIEGVRRIRVEELVVGVKKTSLRAGEIVTAVRVPVLRGGQEFLKVGSRNAMVISVVIVAVVADLDGRNVRAALGSVSPVPLRAREAEEYVGAHVDWSRGQVSGPEVVHRFGALCAAATTPIDDHRSSARYRRHAVAVCAGRALARVLPPHTQPTGGEAR